MIQHEPNEELRTVSATLYAMNGDLLPAATVWVAGMVRISKAGGPFADTVNLPVSVSSEDGAFDLVLDVSEVDTVGVVRVRFYASVGGDLIAEYTSLVEEAPIPGTTPPGVTNDPVTKTDVLAIAPELTTISDEAWADILAYVNTMSPKGICNDAATFRLARILLAAHYGTISKRAFTGAAGPVVSEAAGGLRRAYGLVALSSADAALGQTMYGMQYLGILRSSCAHGPLLI